MNLPAVLQQRRVVRQAAHERSDLGAGRLAENERPLSVTRRDRQRFVANRDVDAGIRFHRAVRLLYEGRSGRAARERGQYRDRKSARGQKRPRRAEVHEPILRRRAGRPYPENANARPFVDWESGSEREVAPSPRRKRRVRLFWHRLHFGDSDRPLTALDYILEEIEK